MKNRINLIGSFILAIAALVCGSIALPKVVDAFSHTVVVKTIYKEKPVAIPDKPKNVDCDYWQVGVSYKCTYYDNLDDVDPFGGNTFKFTVTAKNGEWVQYCSTYYSNGGKCVSHYTFRCGVDAPNVLAIIPKL